MLGRSREPFPDQGRLQGRTVNHCPYRGKPSTRPTNTGPPPASVQRFVRVPAL